MKKTINGDQYYLPGNLNSEQEAIYVHIIDWKRKNITAERGLYRGNEYDAIFPKKTAIPVMMYKPIIPLLKEMQKGNLAYKPHKFAHHAVSSQTACINLFMPLLLSKDADSILPKIPGCPADFGKIAREKLFRGFCFEYWGQDRNNDKNKKEDTGVLNDHSKGAGTDADVAIAYYNKEDKLCLWLIEHKLSEREFTVCGAYKSDANESKDNCTKCNLMEIANDPQKCYYHDLGYKYWYIFKNNHDRFKGAVAGIKGRPFRLGLNQLWRNQMLAFALQENGMYDRVTFSVCHHARNTRLDKSVNQYKALTQNDTMFSSFTNYDVLDAVKTDDPELQKWLQWYKEIYWF